MKVAHSAAVDTLYVKFLEETDAGSNEHGIQRSEDWRTPAGAACQPGEQRENHDRQQNRAQLPARGNGDRFECEFHDRMILKLLRSNKGGQAVSVRNVHQWR
jgi:hypothetical protein